MTVFAFQAVFFQADLFQADSLELQDCCQYAPCTTSMAFVCQQRKAWLEVQAYQGYIEAVLTRVNTVNGRRYSEDPTVFSWELANEATGTVDITGQTVLCCAVLCRAVPCCAVLCCAVLCCAVPCCAMPCCAVLCCAVPLCHLLCFQVCCMYRHQCQEFSCCT